jgi:phosphoribosylformylglycinamidine (FGAM) synthase-like enzyme
MSKLKIVDVFAEMVPKYCVPAAVVGEVEETGMMRCGYW